MEALVTGATGFVGSHVADLLIQRGFSVRAIYRKTSNTRWLQNKPVKLVEASLSDCDSLREAVRGVDYVFHIGGLIMARSQDEFMKANRDGTRNLGEACLETAPNLRRFLYVSSLTAAGPSKSLDEPVTEDMPCSPLTAYGRSKVAAEKAIMELSPKMPVTIVRPPAVYGPRDNGLVPVFKAVKNGIGMLIGFDKKYLSLVHSTDLARGIVDAAMPDISIGEAYYISSDEFYNWVQLMDTMKEAFSKKFLIKLRAPHFVVLSAAAATEFVGQFMKTPPIFNYDKGIDFIQKYWTCSTEKARRHFGYRQEVPLRAGFEETFKWYRDNKWL